MKTKIFTLATVFSLIFNGCSSYKIGNPTNKLLETVFVEPVRNETQIPQMQAILTKNIRQAFLENNFSIENEKKGAECILYVTLKQFSKKSQSIDPDDTDTSTMIEEKISAQCSLWNNFENQWIFKNKTIKVSNHLLSENDYQVSEYQSIPAISEKLASQILFYIISKWDD